MIDNPILGKSYYMAWSELRKLQGGGFYKIKLKKQLGAPNKGFYEADIIEFYFDVDKRKIRYITTLKFDLYLSFDSALEAFKHKTKFSEQDIIVHIFDEDRKKR